MRKLFDLALLEGEGLGTAYEYFVKHRLLMRLLQNSRIDTVLIYGLPEKYGLSLDLFQFCHDHGYDTYLCEEDYHKIRKLLKILQGLGIQPPILVDSVTRKYDLILSSEVMQRLTGDERQNYAICVQKFSNQAVIFVPNKHNKLHSRISGLGGLTKSDLSGLFQGSAEFLDAPPFPPGVRSNSGSRKKMIGFLTTYARYEHLLPFRSRLSHMLVITHGL